MNLFYLAGLCAVSAFRAAQLDYVKHMERIASDAHNRAPTILPTCHLRTYAGANKGLRQASRNAQDAISMLNVADGALGETHAAPPAELQSTRPPAPHRD